MRPRIGKTRDRNVRGSEVVRRAFVSHGGGRIEMVMRRGTPVALGMFLAILLPVSLALAQTPSCRRNGPRSVRPWRSIRM